MKRRGLPYIVNETTAERNEIIRGIRPSLLLEENIGGTFEGALMSLGIAGTIDGNLEGFCAGGIMSYIDGTLKGESIGGLINMVNEKLSGFSYGTFYNHAGENGKIAIQVGAVNNISTYNTDGTVIQVGIYNRCGGQTIPLINIRGLKNLKNKTKK